MVLHPELYTHLNSSNLHDDAVAYLKRGRNEEQKYFREVLPGSSVYRFNLFSAHYAQKLIEEVEQCGNAGIRNRMSHDGVWSSKIYARHCIRRNMMGKNGPNHYDH